jgi:hypothetical protein
VEIPPTLPSNQGEENSKRYTAGITSQKNLTWISKHYEMKVDVGFHGFTYFCILFGPDDCVDNNSQTTQNKWINPHDESNRNYLNMNTE